jgi:hypothetical protein
MAFGGASNITLHHKAKHIQKMARNPRISIDVFFKQVFDQLRALAEYSIALSNGQFFVPLCERRREIKIKFLFSYLVLIAMFIALASVSSHGGVFLQGQCGQTLRESVILTEDIGPCPDPGLIVK